jgi:hypothetical protein
LNAGGLAPSDWPPYTSPDLCGIPSGLEGLGAYAPAQWPPPILKSASRGISDRFRGGNWPPHTRPWPIPSRPPALKIIALPRGDWPPHTRPWPIPSRPPAVKIITLSRWDCRITAPTRLESGTTELPRLRRVSCLQPEEFLGSANRGGGLAPFQGGSVGGNRGVGGHGNPGIGPAVGIGQIG